jgi:chorismate mutase
MIECHGDPDSAWSDSAQQITPLQLKVILEKLVHKVVEIDNQEIKNELIELRNQIDHFDTELINVLSERMNVANLIGKYKNANNITILQPKRWEEIVNRTLNIGANVNLSSDFISKIFSAIHQESINKQTAFIADENSVKTN